jgi:hypothetical protein
MITIDSVLTELFQLDINKLDNRISNRDKKVLISLAKQLAVGQFLTENQSTLLIKIFKENKDSIPSPYNEVIDYPTWSRPFRVLEQFRRMFIAKEHDGRFVVEFTYNKRLRQQISEITKQIDGQLLSLNSKQYSLALTEKNLYLIVHTFKSQGFDIDPLITEFYEEISNILSTDADMFDVFDLPNKHIINAVTKEIGNITPENVLLLNDRRLRFQYSIYPKSSESSLVNSLANRPNTKVWVDSNTTPLTEVVRALLTLNRLPVLVVFNGHESKECLQNLKKLSDALKNNSINSSNGIYFRFDNITDSNKDFNHTIAQLGYNSPLTENTVVAGIANNKLPKFFIKSPWYPMSVITFSNNFKSNKTSVYCDAVDLIVYYNDKRPLGGVDAVV